MDVGEVLRRFGLPPDAVHRDEVRRLLAVEIARSPDDDDNDNDDDPELVRLLCAQLFALGHVEDSLLIWRAKTRDFDAMCGLDVQLLCGAGVDATRAFLAASEAMEARRALEYLDECVRTGDFDGFSPGSQLSAYRAYFGLC
jgi:hypothetical protein